MSDTREFGPLAHISAEAIGQPGQRRFRLRALSEEGDSASLWLEKEQLVALGEAIENILKQESYTYRRLPLDDSEADPVFPLSAQIDFQLAQLSMGVNQDAQRFVLIGASGGPDDSDAESVTMEFDFRRGHELRREIADLAAAGRPPCPLCGAPLNPDGHVCPRSNGHHPR
ncbi:MAG: DUF3090 family protein [Tepidiformaceae bacterium]